MKTLTLLFLLALSDTGQAGEAFGERVDRAKSLENTPAGQAYQDAMWPKVQPFVMALMQKCVPGDPKADLRSFVFVATLSPEADVLDVEVQPVTAVSTCFARGMARAPFPKPPSSLAAGGMPIVLNMRLHDVN